MGRLMNELEMTFYIARIVTVDNSPKLTLDTLTREACYIFMYFKLVLVVNVRYFHEHVPIRHLKKDRSPKHDGHDTCFELGIAQIGVASFRSCST